MQYYFNEYISEIISSSGMDYLIINYIDIREQYYQQLCVGG